MHWSRTDPVQVVDALFIAGPGGAGRLRAALGRHPTLYAAATVVAGEDWAALFAAPMDGESEAVLPYLPGATALHQAAPGWWFPVGTALAVPGHVAPALLAALADRHGIVPPIIAVPRFGGDAAASADLYLAHPGARVAELDW